MYNTLTKRKEPFVPIQGNTVKWYSCGPTVYDAAHIGHARNYMTFDILRRIMTDYFGFDVLYVMNITDVDDKIIIRARQQWLVEDYIGKHTQLDEPALQEMLLEYAQEKLKVSSIQEAISLDTSTDEEGKKKLAQETMIKAKAAIEKRATLSDVYTSMHDVLAFSLDKHHGHTVSDHEIFRSLAAYWEADFLQDMRALNVLPPDYMTRVSEYIPEILAYVQKIIDNGFAYVVDNSVYFDVTNYSKTHPYARLCPTHVGNAKFFEEGEGALGVKLTGKRDPRDFALWKQSKPGEPSWSSPWGNGRPGWHIECSAMANAVIPGHLDIHSGRHRPRLSPSRQRACPGRGVLGDPVPVGELLFARGACSHCRSKDEQVPQKLYQHQAGIGAILCPSNALPLSAAHLECHHVLQGQLDGGGQECRKHRL